MEMECEEIAVELPVTPYKTLNGNHETVENNTESETCEAHQAQSNLPSPTEDSCNLTNTETRLESNVPNETDLISQSHVSLR